MTHSATDDTYQPRDPHHQATPSGALHDPHAADGQAEGLHVHVVPVSLLATVLGLLLFLTFLTVAMTYVDLGNLNIWIAMGIAAAKGSLVVLYFMHLRWDSTFNSMAFVTALLFLALFIGGALLDSGEYLPTFDRPSSAPAATTP